MWGPRARAFPFQSVFSKRVCIPMHMPPGSGLRSRDPLTSHGGGRGDIPVDYDWGGGDHRGGGDDDSPAGPRRY